jgi:hypothetical protein
MGIHCMYDGNTKQGEGEGEGEGGTIAKVCTIELAFYFLNYLFSLYPLLPCLLLNSTPMVDKLGKGDPAKPSEDGLSQRDRELT